MSLNPIRPWRNIERRKSRQIMVGNVPVGGDAPISVQTMTNTDGRDVRATLDQVIRAADAGADIVRISAPDQDTTRALKEICRESPVPIVADIHFHYKRAIEAALAMAQEEETAMHAVESERCVPGVVRAGRQSWMQPTGYSRPPTCQVRSTVHYPCPLKRLVVNSLLSRKRRRCTR